MNIYHLKYFFDAARTGSISRAAEINFVSHSAVSQAIQSLERLLGSKLVNHARRRFQLTQQGELCLREIPTILASLDDFKEKIQSGDKEPVGELKMMLPQSLIIESFYKTALEFRKKYPWVDLKMTTGSVNLVKAGLLESRIHLGLAIDDGNLGAYQSVSVKKGAFVLVARSKKSHLKDSGFIVTASEKIEVRHLIKTYFMKFKKEPRIDIEIVSWSAIKSLAKKGSGIGYLPDYCVQDELRSGQLVEIPPPGERFKYEIKALWLQSRRIHPNANLMLDLLKGPL